MANGILVHLWLAEYSTSVIVILVRKFCCFPPPASLSPASSFSEKGNRGIMEIRIGEDGLVSSASTEFLSVV